LDGAAPAAAQYDMRGHAVVISTVFLTAALLPLMLQVGAIKDLCDLVFNPPDGERQHVVWT
jgi:hypothetical protein